MRRIIIVSLLLASFIVSNCASEEPLPDTKPERTTAAPIAAKQPQRDKFSPPADSTVSDKQFALWKECGIILDSLTYFYADSFKVADPVTSLRIQEDYMKAKDRICRKAGLAGQEEYNWISTHVTLPKNISLLRDD